MSDFDFDELDKAVSGVLGGTTKDDQQKQPVVQAAPVTPSVTEPLSVAPASASVSSLSTQPTSLTAPAARRSAGRFMDVVHPSSDMRTGTGSEVNTSVSERPSILSVDTDQKTSDDTPGQSPSVDDPTPDWSQPLESPFLPDAKVEKRPLGGEALMASVFEVENTLAEPQAQREPQPEVELPNDAPAEAHTMPDPLDFTTQNTAQVLAVEPTQTEDEDATPSSVEDHQEMVPAQTSELFPAQLDDIHPEPVQTRETTENTEELEEKDQVEPVELVGPTSIVQQYTEVPRSEQVSGAIFDTEAYHQPVAHPAKKKSGLGIILAILGLLVVGAGVGVAFYFYALPML